MGTPLAERLAVVDRLLADPPVVHPMERAERPRMGVWSTEPEAYRFIAERCDAGTRTLETGCGLSTALFAALGCDHTCAAAAEDEVARVRAYCELKGFPTERVRFETGGSHAILPRLLGDGELDLVLIDGSHGFPMPTLDWFYAGSRLRRGGLAVIDDVHLPAVRSLLQFLSVDPRWRQVHGGPKWHAYERRRGGTLSEDWTEQPHFTLEDPGVRAILRGLVSPGRFRGRARWAAGRATRRGPH